MKEKLCIVILFVCLFFQLIGENNIAEAGEGTPTHGDSNTWVTEEQLDFSIPKDYAVNKSTQGEGKDGLYNAFFLKDDIQTISIEIDENNLNYMFQNAVWKPTVMAKKVTIGDESVEYVGLKTKGSYTLYHSYTDNPQSDRFSLTINFGKYVKKKDYGETQNFYGVEKISLNNFFFDKSMMKEYCALMLMQAMGVPTPQFGLCKLYINGRYYGVYSMIESLDSPILEQYYNCSAKEISDYLCKPEGTQFIYENLKRNWAPMWEEDEDTYKKVEKMLPTVQEWVRKLNLLSDGMDFNGDSLDVNSDEYLTLLNQVIDIDEFLRYFAAHSFLCQLDNMFVGQKNFGLYVGEDGKALLVPWDYDLSFGTFSPATADATANFPLDQMFINSNGGNAAEFELEEYYSEYPLFNVIYQNASLMEKYHTYMLDCAKIMALGGTTSFGSENEPGLANSRIQVLTETLTQAATEKTTKRAAYMNGISQPRDLKAALTNLSKIITMRSVGVYCQVENIAGHVTGKGCNLAQVGNGQDNWWLQDSGTIIATQPSYGIFTKAKYQGAIPQLTVKEITSQEQMYETVLAAVGDDGKGSFKIYSLKDSAASKLQGEYTVYVALGSESRSRQLSFYSYENGQLSELTMNQTDEVFSYNTEKLGYLVIKERDKEEPETIPSEKAKKSFIWIIPLAGLAAIAALAGILVGRGYKKNK